MFMFMKMKVKLFIEGIAIEHFNPKLLDIRAAYGTYPEEIAAEQNGNGKKRAEIEIDADQEL